MRTPGGWALRLAAVLFLLGACVGGAPCPPSLDGAYTASITTVTPAGTTARRGSFTVSGGTVSDPDGTFIGTIDAAGAFTGTSTVCQACAPLPITGRFTTDGEFTLSGSSGSVSQTIVARRTEAACAATGGGGSANGGGAGGGGGGGGGADGGGAGGSGGGGSLTGGGTGGGAAMDGGSGGGGGGGGNVELIDAGEPEPNDAGPGETFVASRPAPFGLALDDTHVYWTERSGTVARAAKSSGVAQALVTNRGGDPYRIDVDATRVYWNELLVGTIQSMPKAGGAMVQVHHDDAAGVRIVAGAAYWPNVRFGTIHRVGVDGSGLTTLVAGLNAPALATADATHAWFTHQGPTALTGGGLGKVPVGSGTVTWVASGLCDPSGFALDATHVYLAERCADLPGRGTIKKVSLGGGPVATLARNLGGPTHLGLGQGFVYWSESGANAIRKVGLTGGAVTTLANTSEAAADLAVDATHVYWTEPDAGVVRRAPK